MNHGFRQLAKSPTLRYAAMGAFFGLIFPVGATAMLVALGAISAPATVVGMFAAAHAHSPVMVMIDTAPIFLGVFAGFAGVRQTKLIALNASLEEKVACQTASLRDALQRAEKTNVMIAHMADHDTMTGLLNRRCMHKELAAAVALTKRYGDPFAMVFIDLNRFKAINDKHGHDAGDRLLNGFAAILEQTTRDTDRASRWGGDEFVVLLSRSSRQGAQQFAERLQAQLSRQTIDIGPARIALSASVGIAVHPEDGPDPEALLAHADQDMYRAKHELCAA